MRESWEEDQKAKTSPIKEEEDCETKPSTVKEDVQWLRDLNEELEKYHQNITQCTQSVAKFNEEQAKGPDLQKLQALNAELAIYKRSLEECIQSMIKFKSLAASMS